MKVGYNHLGRGYYLYDERNGMIRGSAAMPSARPPRPAPARRRRGIIARLRRALGGQ